MRHLFRCLCLCLILGAYWTCFADDQATIKQIQANLPEVKAAAQQLGSLAPQVRLSAFLIGVLGIVAAACSRGSTAWTKRSAFASGIAISLLTLVSTTYYVLDYKTLKFLAKDAHDVSNAVTANIENFEASKTIEPPQPAPDGSAEPQKNREAEKYLSDIASGQLALNRLERQAREGGHSLNVNIAIPYIRPVSTVGWMVPAPGPFPFEAVVHASEVAKPAWVEKPPYDKFRVGYVGIAACNTAFGAREMARYNALESAALEVHRNTGLELDSASLFVERNAQEAGNYFFVDSYSKLYWHHTLVYLDRDKSSREVAGKYMPPAFMGDARWIGTARIPPHFSGSLTVEDPARSRNEGRFKFFLRASGKGDIALERVEVLNSSSTPSTRWIFKFLANGNTVIHFPLHRFEDSGHPTAYQIRPEQNRRGTLPGAGEIQLRVEGFKPKDVN